MNKRRKDVGNKRQEMCKWRHNNYEYPYGTSTFSYDNKRQQRSSRIASLKTFGNNYPALSDIYFIFYAYLRI